MNRAERRHPFSPTRQFYLMNNAWEIVAYGNFIQSDIDYEYENLKNGYWDLVGFHFSNWSEFMID